MEKGNTSASTQTDAATDTSDATCDAPRDDAPCDALAATRLREAQLDLREARIVMRQKLTETEAELMAARRKAADDETFALNAQEALKEMSRKVKEVGELKMKLQSSLERMKHRIRELKHEKHIMKCAVKTFATAYVGAGKHKDAVVKTFADAFTSM